MAKDKAKKKKNHHTLSTLAMCVVVMMVVGYYCFVQYPEIHSQKQQLSAINLQIRKETAKTDQLVRQQKELSSSEYIEKIAREELGLLKPNETVYVDITKNKQ
jgi:cell division protein FtsL